MGRTFAGEFFNELNERRNGFEKGREKNGKNRRII
jgi:hypothetical protein